MDSDRRQITSERLTLLADFIESEVPQHRMDMTLYQEDDFSSDPECDSSACALGWATCVPQLALSATDFDAWPDETHTINFRRYFYRLFGCQVIDYTNPVTGFPVHGLLYKRAFIYCLSSDKPSVVSRLRDAAEEALTTNIVIRQQATQLRWPTVPMNWTGAIYHSEPEERHE